MSLHDDRSPLDRGTTTPATRAPSGARAPTLVQQLLARGAPYSVLRAAVEDAAQAPACTGRAD